MKWWNLVWWRSFSTNSSEKISCWVRWSSSSDSIRDLCHCNLAGICSLQWRYLYPLSYSRKLFNICHFIAVTETFITLDCDLLHDYDFFSAQGWGGGNAAPDGLLHWCRWRVCTICKRSSLWYSQRQAGLIFQHRSNVNVEVVRCICLRL